MLVFSITILKDIQRKKTKKVKIVGLKVKNSKESLCYKTPFKLPIVKKIKGNSAKRCHKKSAFWITILKDIQIKESKKMKNEQRVTKNWQGRLWSTISTKIEGYDCDF